VDYVINEGGKDACERAALSDAGLCVNFRFCHDEGLKVDSVINEGGGARLRAAPLSDAGLCVNFRFCHDAGSPSEEETLGVPVILAFSGGISDAPYVLLAR